jgi:glucose-1-phosphate adenylyltransferase
MPLQPRILALVLAGGEGSRLGPLTDRRAKPNTPYAGTYRLIDVALSNCTHSGIADVWVVEQYRPHRLNEHLAGGRAWDLDRSRGGLRVLPPWEGTASGEDDGREGFARGNADALHQHAGFVRTFSPDAVLVLSADHLYRLDYAEVYAAHRASGAALTAVTTEVPQKDASSYSVVQVEGDRITDFAYKPDDPKGGTVCAEVFLYQPDALLDTLDLLAERTDDDSLGDYGDGLLPHLVETADVRAFSLRGYWHDCGTPERYWQAHRDLLDGRFRPDSPDWPLLTTALHRLPARIFGSARIENSLVAPGSEVGGRVVRSILAPDVLVEDGAVVVDSVLLRGVRVGAGARVERTLVDERVRICADARVGGADEITVIGMDREIGEGDRVEPGATLDAAPSDED